MSKRKVVLYISMSVDGFIATNDHDLSWLSLVDREGEDYGYNAFTANVDTYIVGRKTYDVVLGLTGGVFPQAKQYQCYVITRQDLPDTDGVTFYKGDLKALIAQLKSQEGGTIYCDGGSAVVQMLMEHNLIDEYIISVIPTLLGDGIKLFKGGVSAIQLEAATSKQYASGLVQLHYKVVRS